ncbi:DUF58 domain-containing protein [Marinagarivorans cellulosilyticus]|uniref:DUF58 domain-containing protein n=1 Tax=Marinagarivorans cellulosilyticus TaxID=2721545 RepID=A0AAN1WJ33_9GAMM|nr:DUF58 domain-containing protein [Marinagarivorans cellulosilyticus]BCD98573.1 hypothetical protein MARGE09_P2774 [Marinagarivorans cellulosilyticus]
MMSEPLFNNAAIYCQAEDLFALRPLGQKLLLGQARASQSIMAGDVRTRYKGRGMSFAEVRPYQAGDDIRTIDWRVTARTQKPYTKLFEEERERPIFLMVDMRSSMFFGSQHQFKCVYAARIAVAMAWAACAAGDRIGAMILSDHGEWDLRPKRGKNAVLALIHALVDANKQLSNPAQSSGRSLAQFIEDGKRIIRPGAMVYLISDGHDSQGINAPLCTLARHADITFMHVYDTMETQLPAKGLFTISDGENRTTVNSKAINQRYGAYFEQQQKALKTACIQAMVTGINAPVSGDLDNWLLDVLGKRSAAKHKHAMQTSGGQQ